MFKTALILTLGLAANAAVQARTDLCDAPRAQWQAVPALEKKLAAAGWTIKRVKVDKGCYEVYGTDGKGQRVETYFDPKTLDRVKG